MRSFPRIFRTLVGVNYALMLEYRAEIYLWALSNMLPFLMMALWVQAARHGHYPLSAAQLGSYFVAAFIVRQYTTVWVIWEFEFDMVHGRLSPMLLRPVNPVWWYVTMHLGEKMARTPFAMLILLVALLVYPPARWTPRPWDLAAGVAATAAAFGLRFLMQYAVTMLTFWYERAASVENLFFLPYLFLSGTIAPLEMFPPGVRQVALLTPFPYLMDFPAHLYLGQYDGWRRALAVMGFWALVFFALRRWGWTRGLRQYSAMGA